MCRLHLLLPHPHVRQREQTFLLSHQLLVSSASFGLYPAKLYSKKTYWNQWNSIWGAIGPPSSVYTDWPWFCRFLRQEYFLVYRLNLRPFMCKTFFSFPLSPCQNYFWCTKLSGLTIRIYQNVFLLWSVGRASTGEVALRCTEEPIQGRNHINIWNGERGLAGVANLGFNHTYVLPCSFQAQAGTLKLRVWVLFFCVCPWKPTL